MIDPTPGPTVMGDVPDLDLAPDMLGQVLSSVIEFRAEIDDTVRRGQEERIVQPPNRNNFGGPAIQRARSNVPAARRGYHSLADAEIVRGPQAVPTGRNLTARLTPEVQIEYVEWNEAQWQRINAAVSPED